MRKLSIFLLLILLITILPIPEREVEAQSPLKDLRADGREEIQRLVDEGIISGFSDGTFRPNIEVTRAQAVAMISRSLNLDGTKRETTFSDVSADYFASGYIASAAQRNIVSGYSDGTFRPGNPVTRGETAAFLSRAFTLVNTDSMYFRDITTNTPGNRAINRLAATGITIGYSDGTFRAGESISRHQFAIMLARALYPEFRQPILEVRAGKTIVIDPGHGGRDPGAVAFGVREKDVVLSVGLILERKLSNAGFNVIMTRKTDVFIELEQRVAIANNANADAFVSLHANAAGSSAAHGTETYWNRTHSSQESKELAEAIQKELIKKLKTRDRGVKEANFYVTRHTKMPSVLVEIGFVTNEQEARKLNSASFQEEAAEAIYQGIVEFYKRR